MYSNSKERNHKPLPNVHPANSLILPDGKIFKVQRKRQRKIHSCIPCHQRKIKCSRESPTCYNCLKLAVKNPSEKSEILNACKYFDNDKKKNLKTKGVELTSLVNNNLTNFNLQDQSSNNNNDTSDNNSNDDRFNHVLNENELHPSKSDNSNISNETSNNEFNQSNKNDSKFNDTNTIDNTFVNPNLNMDPAEFVYIPKNNPADNSGFVYINEQADLNSVQSNLYPDNQIYSNYSKQFASQFIPILNNLPTKERSDQLLKTFQTNIHTLLPILDMNSFVEKYNEFWYCGLFLTDNIESLYQYFAYFKDKQDSPQRIKDFLYWFNKTNGLLNPLNFPEFLILLFAMYYTSISSSVYEFLSKKYDNFNNILSYKNEVNKYYNTFKKINHKGLNNPRIMSLAALQINVLVQSITNLKSGKSLINISKILRICQFYQLNRDPVTYHSLKDNELIQTRRIVWWQIFLLDNLVSFFLNLTPSIKLSDFDTKLLMENLESDSNLNLSIMYLNCMFRFILIVDDLNGLTNGLNTQMKDEDINKMTKNINELFITCNSTMKKIHNLYHKTLYKDISDTNSSLQTSPITTPYMQTQISPQTTSSIEFDPLLNSAPNNTHNTSLDYYKFFMSSLKILSDKMLIMLQKKILLNPYMNADNPQTNSNLNLQLTNVEYTYTDLQNNLLPSLLHYLDTFLLLSKKDMLKFNWKLKNYIPIDELILLMQILAANLKTGMSQQEDSKFSDINLKIYLVDQTINSLKLNWHLKLSSVNKLISLASNLWELMILKFNIDLALPYSMSDKFIFPKPVNEIHPTNNHSINSKISSSNYAASSEMLSRNTSATSTFDTSLTQNTSNTCIDDSNPNRPIFYKIDTSGEIKKKPSTIEMTLNIKERFLSVARLVEDELSKENNNSIIQETDDDDEEGWYNLGTEQEYGLNSIDDFHFYKNLKSDVIRLFKSVVF
jgi:hypothetical protein